MLTLHYYSNAKGVRATLTKVTTGWWSEDDDPVYSKHLIKEFEVENPPLEDELAWILKKGISIFRHLLKILPDSRERVYKCRDLYTIYIQHNRLITVKLCYRLQSKTENRERNYRRFSKVLFETSIIWVNKYITKFIFNWNSKIKLIYL